MDEPIEAIYENGVFRPLGPVPLPEHARVRIEASPAESQSETGIVTKEGQALRPEGDFPAPWTDEDDQALASLPPEQRPAAIRLRRLAGALADAWTDKDDQILGQIQSDRQNGSTRENLE